MEALHSSGRSPVLVVSQPPRPVGRGRRLTHPPVAQWALEHDLDLAQPSSGVRNPEFLDRLRAFNPTLSIVVAFGEIFSRELLELPDEGSVNVHASLLPRHRGAAPIAAAVAAGDRETGVTILQMTEGLDSGPILHTRGMTIGADETAEELSERMSLVGAETLLEALEQREAQGWQPVPQDDSLATYAGKLKRSDARIDWHEPARSVYNGFRSRVPWPGTTFAWAGESVRVLAMDGPNSSARTTAAEDSDEEALVGEVVEVGPEGLRVLCGDGQSVLLTKVQRPGRRAVAASDFARGVELVVGTRLGGYLE